MPTLDELLDQYESRAASAPSPPAPSPAANLDELLARYEGRTVQNLASPQPTPPADPADIPGGPQPRDPAREFATAVGQRMVGPRIPAGQMIGGAVGGIAAPLLLGRLIPGPIDDAAYAIAAITGAGIGGGAGEGVQQAVSPSENVNFRKMGEAALAESLSEVGGRVGSAAAGYVGRKLISKKSIENFAQAIVGAPIDPTQAGDRLYEMVGRRVRDSSGNLRRGGVHKELDAYFGPWKQRINAQTAAGAGASITSLKQVAQDAIDAHERGARILHPDDLKELRTIAGMKEDVMPFDWLEGHKTYWQGENARLSHDAKVSDTGLIKLADEARRLQTDASSWVGIPPEVAPEIVAFNRAYSESKELMDMVYPRRFTESLKARPEKAVDLIGNPPAQSARGPWLRQIQNAKRALTTMPDGRPIPGGQQAWENLRTAWWTGQINKYASSGDFDTVGFEKMLNLMGDKALPELFSKEELARARDVQRLLASKNARVLNQGAAVLGTLGVAGGYGAGLGWDIYHDVKNGDYLGVAKDGAVVMTAGVLATATRSKKYAALVSSILQHRPREPKVIPNVVRLARALANDRDETEARLRRDVGRQQWEQDSAKVSDLGGYRNRMLGR